MIRICALIVALLSFQLTHELEANPAKWFRGAAANRAARSAGAKAIHLGEETLMDGRKINIQLLTDRATPHYGVTVGDSHSFLIEEVRKGGVLGSGHFLNELQIVNSTGPLMGRLEFGGSGSVIDLGIVHGIESSVLGMRSEAGTALKATMLKMYAEPGTIIRSSLVETNLDALKKVFRRTRTPSPQDLAAIPALKFQGFEFALGFERGGTVNLALNRTYGSGLTWGPKNYRSLYLSNGAINPDAEEFINFLYRYTRKNPTDTSLDVLKGLP